MTIDQIKAKYEPRILALLNQIRQHLIRMGYPCSEPYDMTDEEYGWQMLVGDTDTRKCADITFTIIESEVRDGTMGGVSFFLNLTQCCGRVLGGYCPGNFSGNLWVPRNDEDAIEERFQLFEDPDLDMRERGHGIYKNFADTDIEQVLIDGQAPANYAYDWINGGCAMHQWCSGAKDLSPALIDHIDGLIAEEQVQMKLRPTDSDPITQADNLTDLKRFLVSQLAQPQEAA